MDLGEGMVQPCGLDHWRQALLRMLRMKRDKSIHLCGDVLRWAVLVYTAVFAFRAVRLQLICALLDRNLDGVAKLVGGGRCVLIPEESRVKLLDIAGAQRALALDQCEILQAPRRGPELC